MEKNGCINHLNNNHIIEKKRPKDPPLFRLESCPPWLRFNKYILGGYRCHLSTSQCVDSLFYIHNETFNIYSHGIPCAFFLFLVPMAASSACLANPVWFFLHYFACFAPFFASPIYHLFMCHQNGQDAYHKLLTFDVCGVWAINAFGGLCGIRSTFYCLPFCRSISLTFYIAVSMLSVYFILIANSPKERFKPLVVFGAMRYFFVAVRLLLYTFNITNCSISAMPYYLSMDLLAFIGGH
ncbi:Progestin and adipoQ receptor member 4 [Desmophyllum pertusum]|uniref:Progestin and adipoQ receptor member 4 n=1 Tax=Desmophyllum pertusum TaxID=174260 RepID=A0A9W9Z8K9_9CNID|nr:Progestin and adipoQ receptor member 4 [Desmophyllum pertusum]